METWRQVKASHTDTDKSEVIREAERQRDREARTQDPTLPQGGGAASPRVQAWGTQTGTLPIHQGNEAVVLTLQCEVAAVQTCTQIHVHESNCETLNLCFKLFCAIQLKYHAEIPSSAKVWYAGIPNSTKVLVCWNTQFSTRAGCWYTQFNTSTSMPNYQIPHKYWYTEKPSWSRLLVSEIPKSVQVPVCWNSAHLLLCWLYLCRPVKLLFDLHWSNHALENMLSGWFVVVWVVACSQCFPHRKVAVTIPTFHTISTNSCVCLPNV